MEYNIPNIKPSAGYPGDVIATKFDEKGNPLDSYLVQPWGIVDLQTEEEVEIKPPFYKLYSIKL